MATSDCPGALPIPKIWIAQEIDNITSDRQVIWGQMVGQIDEAEPLIFDESFQAFLMSKISMPPIIDYGDEDHVMEFKITDTAKTKEFQQKVTEHYENMQDMQRIKGVRLD